MDIHQIKEIEAVFSSSVPGQSVDCVIFRYQNSQLQVLLLKLRNFDVWALPGGFVYKNEDLDNAAMRIVKERVGIKSIFLNQFYTFGDYNRRNINQLMQQLNALGMKSPLIIHWFSQRFITTAYLALVNITNVNMPQKEKIGDRVEWVPVKNLPELVFDHVKIINKALERLRTQINYLPIGMNLLNETFTMKELQRLYETILDIKLDRGNFQRKILKLNILIRLDKQYSGQAHKAPYLYRFDKKRYFELNKKGIGFIR